MKELQISPPAPRGAQQETVPRDAVARDPVARDPVARDPVKKLLERYIDHHVRHGVAPDPEELCRRTPELLEPLREHIAAYQRVDRALAPAWDLKPGQSLLHYRVVEKLGEGGMGQVYAAQDQKLDRRVALKILSPEMAGDREWLERFRREAKAVAALNHPNIVTLHSVEEADGLHFFTMELVDGPTLTRHIGRRGLPLAELFDLAIPITDALAAAHERGIIHRDLKPRNIMVTGGRRVKVLDFGLAKLGRDSAVDPVNEAVSKTEEPSTWQDLTADGRILGTMPYMSPEQVMGHPVDARSDIFSLGVILYEMATGRLPFKGENAVELIAAILRGTPRPVDELRDEVPHHLGRIVRQCLEKDPERRLQSAKDLRNELEDLKQELASEVTVAKPAMPPARRSVLLWFALLAVVILIATAIWRLRGPEPSPPMRPEVQTLVDQALNFEQRGYTRSDLAEAEDRYRRALALEPADPLPLEGRLARLLVRIQMQYASPERAEEIGRLIADTLARDPDLAPALVAQGELALNGGDTAAAEEAARRAIRAAPSDYSGYSLLGRTLIRLDRADLGLSELRKGVSQAGSDMRARLALATELKNLGRSNEAAVQYEEVLSYDPDSPNALNNLGIIYGKAGQHLDAIRLLKHLLELYDDEAAALNLGEVYSRVDRLEEAKQMFLKAYSLAPEKPLAPHSLGDLHERLGELDEAQGWYEKAVESYDLDLAAGGQRARNLGFRAVCAARLGRFDEALENIREALELTPRHSYRLFNAAQVHALAGNRDEVYRYLDRATEAGFSRQEIQSDPCLRAFREDPEFRALLED